MTARAELLVNLWTYGVPALLIVWAILRLAADANARLRYALAVAGLGVSLALALISPSLPHRLASASGPAAPIRETAGLALPDAAARGITWLWLAISIALLLRDVTGHLRLFHARRTLAPAPSALKKALQWPESVPLLIGDQPCTLGLLRPAAVLPSDLLERFPARLARSIAAHELSHARWRDPLVYAFCRIVLALFWVSPHWIALRWIRRERETAADAAALATTSGEEESYVSALLCLARPHAQRMLGAAMAGSDLEYRARHILSPRRHPLVAIAALTAGIALLSCATPASFERDDRVAVGMLTPRTVIKTAERIRTVHTTPSKDNAANRTPKRRRAPRNIDEAIENAIDARIDDALIPIARDLSSLPSAPAVTTTTKAPASSIVESTHIDVHRDVDRHVHEVRDVDRRPEAGDDQRIRIVIRNRT